MTITINNAEVGEPIEFTVDITGLYSVKVITTPDADFLQNVGVAAEAGEMTSVPWAGTVPDGKGCAIAIALESTVENATAVIAVPSDTPEPPEPEPPTPTDLTVAPATATIEVGQSSQLAATAAYSDGSQVDVTNDVTWSSSATGKATVTAAGKVTAVAAGSATITAAFEGWTDACTVTVTAPAPATSYPSSPDEVGVPDGVTLTAYTGPSVIETAGTVIDSKDITKTLVIRAPNVTVKRSRVKPSSGADYAVKQEGNSKGFVFEDCEIDGTNGRVDRAILIYDNARISRCYLHGSRRFVYLAGGNYTTVEDCYISDNVNTTDAHTSAIGSNGGLHHCKVLRNVLQTGKNTNASSALSMYPETNMGGNGDDILIDGNLFNTGGGYGVYLGHTPPEHAHTNCRVTNNWFGTLYYVNCGQYGPVASWSRPSEGGTGNVWTNNRWRDQGNGGAGKDGQLIGEPSRREAPDVHDV